MSSEWSKNQGFEEVASCQVAGVPVSKYKSTRTGLVVCLARVKSPLVKGYFCLATEAHDHDGLPHTLEHLIFMGSEDYPYKGVLDLLANRSLAQGTNAWTDVDHTCYTMDMAGSHGFLNLLPIYLDHILYPILTDASFLTEVHHVNGEGADAGVVYCEMQARENTSEDIVHFWMAQHMYPGHCGYKSSTGGRMENLRTSCSNEKVRSYHAAYYRPDNLCIIVTGQVDPELLFKSLTPFEDKIISKDPLPKMPRPWQSEVPPLLKSVTQVVRFPTDEEEEAEVLVAWRGPSATEDRYGMNAMGCLMEYLSETSVAPLQRELVEIEDPFCSEIEELVMENVETVFGFSFSGVPMEKLKELPVRVQEVLEGLASGQEELEMQRMAAIIKKSILNILNNVEASPHNFFAMSIIGDFLFSKTADQFSSYIDELPRFKRLLLEPSTFWVELVKKYVVAGPSVVIMGSPSSELASKIALEEKERINEQAKSLGAEGLKRRKAELEHAMSRNEVPPPPDMISNLPIPTTNNIFFHPLVLLGNHQPEELVSGLPEYAKFPVHRAPFFLHVNHIHSAFVELMVVLDIGVLAPEQLLYLPLYLEMIFESPVMRDGKLVPYEAVVKELEADTIEMSAGLGMDGGRFSTGVIPQAAFIEIKVEADKYSVGVQHLSEILSSVQFTKERLLVVANKMANDVSSFKREGSHVVKTLMRHQLYVDHSSANISNMLTQAAFLSTLTDTLKNSAQEVIIAMETVQDRLTSPDNVRVFLAADVNSLPLSDPLAPWQSFLPHPSSVVPSALSPVPSLKEFLRPSPVQAQIVGVAGVDSNYLIQMTPCVISHVHPDLPAIMVFIEYLIALEGPMWQQIRGMGLSYNYRMSCHPDEGQLHFHLSESSQLVQAFKVAKEIMDGYICGSKAFEEMSLEAAISGVVYELIRRTDTVACTASQAVLNHFRHLEANHRRNLLSSVSAVTLNDLKRVGGLYFSKLFDPLESVTAVCCSPGKVKEVKAGLEELGVCSIKVVKNLKELAIEL